MNQARPKTIQIFLPDGNARSIRIAEITSRTVQAVQIPRSKLEAVTDRKEVKQPGVYLLFGDNLDLAKDSVYIGEAENCLDRLHNHNRNKDFWNTAVAITSKTERFTKSHIKYLEWYCHQKAEYASRFKVENSNNPTEPHLPEPDQADLLDNFGTMKILVSTLGFPVFDDTMRRTKPPKKQQSQLASTEDLEKQTSEEYIYVLQRGNIRARGQYIEDGFLVLKGAEARKEFKSSARERIKALRKSLVEEGILRLAELENKFIFTEDYIFTSPSAASSLIAGVSSNGWRAWKEEKTGKTLDQIVRKN